jgi:hypothetical protein
VRLLFLVAVLVCIAAIGLLLTRMSGTESPWRASRDPAGVAAPLAGARDSAQAHVEQDANDKSELDTGAPDSSRALAQEQEPPPFVPAAIIRANVLDEAGTPIHEALVRGLRDARDSKPITASNAAGMIRLVSDRATTNVVISAPGFRSRRFDDVADGDVLTLLHGIGIVVQVPVAAVRIPPQRLRVLLTPKGTLPWFRMRGTTDFWTGADREDGDLVQPAHDFLRAFGEGEITGMFDATGTAHVVVSDPGEYEVRFVLGTIEHVTIGYDLKGPTDFEALREITPYPRPCISVGERDEGRSFPISLRD